MANNPAHMENLVSLKKGYDPKRNVTGLNKGSKHCTLKSCIDEINEMSPEEVCNLMNMKLPPQYKNVKTMRKAIMLRISMEALNGNLKAAKLFHDRDEGKPRQTIEVQADISSEELRKMSDEQLRKLAGEID